MKGQWLLVITLTLLVLVSAFAVIEIKHESRKRFVELQALEKERDRMNIEWGRLQIEQGTLATHSQIEQIANKQLHMKIPETDSIVIIKRQVANSKK
jgi:cell division protein FtsL